MEFIQNLEVINTLAVLIGVPCLIGGLSMMFVDGKIQAVVKDMKANHALQHIGSIMMIVFGLLIVTSHNVWTDLTTCLISFFGWGMIIDGVIMQFNPKFYFSSRFFNKTTMKALPVLVVAIGAYLVLEGFGMMM